MNDRHIELIHQLFSSAGQINLPLGLQGSWAIDGPFAETREQLGGYFLIDAADLDEAINIAGRIPAARKGIVEIRPILELAGLPSEQ
ncbi:hypothetical protein IQ241_17570 [Romeria aff. gracilis LEGE 07310]|uniref:YCII-related domain-containing protein n=1 Tax=Vasconcelosia minhoensis LEGE 07310 TaxID=915328 RepID=A0A8J7DP44_9CYAN|nr:YciI family protein [Romeria gracilis]MBE9079085.1 hypothetical protein [Romeria aff. gracilis LEGE 07310]